MVIKIKLVENEETSDGFTKVTEERNIYIFFKKRWPLYIFTEISIL